MMAARLGISNLMLYLVVDISNAARFERYIEAIGIPYYKVAFILGTCQDNILFTEHKAWPVATMNRIMDIYYKSEISEITVSSVEIKLVINNTDCVGVSKYGVGFPEFSATIYFSTNMAVIFYSLKIFTCSRHFIKALSTKVEVSPNLPFYTGTRRNKRSRIIKKNIF